jgi:outer membrane protein OmpA-like peptidoglycan-associated protein
MYHQDRGNMRRSAAPGGFELEGEGELGGGCGCGRPIAAPPAGVAQHGRWQRRGQEIVLFDAGGPPAPARWGAIERAAPWAHEEEAEEEIAPLEGFGFDQSGLTLPLQARVRAAADEIVAAVRAGRPVDGVKLTGHTDPVGDPGYNQRLGDRRAEAVRALLVSELRRRDAALAARLAITVEPSPGATQPIAPNTTPDGRARNRRVQLTLLAPSWCRGRVRLHFKILVAPVVPVATMVANMRTVYRTAGLAVELASTENLSLPALEDLDIHCNGSTEPCLMPCARADLNASHASLFSHRNGVGANELAIYVVHQTIPPVNGICVHPVGRPGVVVAGARASGWTLAHEVAHTLGLQHITSEPHLATGGCVSTFVPTRLMTDCSTSRLQGTPTLIPSEIATMTASALALAC